MWLQLSSWNEKMQDLSDEKEGIKNDINNVASEEDESWRDKRERKKMRRVKIKNEKKIIKLDRNRF